MKNFIVFSLLCSGSMVSFGQKITPKTYTIKTVEKIDFEKLYNKQTGEKISEKEFHKLVGTNKNYSLEKKSVLTEKLLVIL